jgi:hypothetical protein
MSFEIIASCRCNAACAGPFSPGNDRTTEQVVDGKAAIAESR